MLRIGANLKKRIQIFIMMVKMKIKLHAKIFLFLAASLLCYPMVAHSLTTEYCDEVSVRVAGTIKSGDLKKIQTTCSITKIGPISQLIISSDGGDVEEAIKIGRWVRANKMWVGVPERRGCYSACVYILAAGVVRHTFGEIGIHRPYFLRKPNEGFDTALKNILSESKKYFAEMNINERLAEDMFSISPQNMRILSENELDLYRLSQTDMAHEEERTIRNAEAFGLQRDEYLRRMRLSKKYEKECRDSKPAPKNNDESISIIWECIRLGEKKAGLVHP